METTVKSYDNAQLFQHDRKKMQKDGWTIQSTMDHHQARSVAYKLMVPFGMLSWESRYFARLLREKNATGEPTSIFREESPNHTRINRSRTNHIGVPALLARSEQHLEHSRVKRMLVGREGMATEFLARLHARCGVSSRSDKPIGRDFHSSLPQRE
jgi:hypothetical protein